MLLMFFWVKLQISITAINLSPCGRGTLNYLKYIDILFVA